MEDLIIIGGGGHSKSVIDSAETMGLFRIIGILTTNNKPLFGYQNIGGDDALPILYSQGVRYCFIAIGSIGDTEPRYRLYKKVLELGYNLPNIVDPSSTVSKRILFGKGIFVGKNAIINANSEIEDMVIINSGATIEHDCSIGNLVHIAPGAVICGNSKIGNGTHIGAGATVMQGIVIGEHTLIGCGSVVVSDIPGGVKAYGNPCKVVGRFP